MIRYTISGALLMGYIVASMFFFKFWSESRDRLFGLFASAFALMAVQRLLLAFAPAEVGSLPYVVRLFAFVLIIAAIVDKNRTGR